MGICAVHYTSGRSAVVFKKKAPSVKKLMSSCSLGISAFIGEFSSGITTLVFNFILLNLAGNTAVAAYGVIANIALVGTALLNGVSLGLQPVASAAHCQAGSGSEKKIYRQSLKIGEYIALAVAAASMLFADQLVAVFNSENSLELAAYASEGLMIYSFGFLIAAVNIVRAGFYSAIGKGAEASVIALSRGIFTISLTALLLSDSFGVVGVWLAFPVSEIITLFLSMLTNALCARRCRG